MMTWEEFLASDLTLEDYVTPLVQEAIAKLNTPVQEAIDHIKAGTASAEQRIAECEFERLVRDNALLGGVLPKAVHHIAASARELFELRENALVVRNGATHPGDPLTPLTFDVWLEGLRKEMGFLFVKP